MTMSRLTIIALAAAGLMAGGAQGQTRAPGATTLAAIGAENPDADVNLPGATAEPASEAAAPPRDAAPPATAHTGNPLCAIPMRKLSATRDRPLFSPSRRPPPPVVAAAPAPVRAIEVAPPPPPVPENPPLVLVGTIIGDKEKIAIFVNLTSNETKRVREGAAEAGWTLRTVELRTAVLERNSRSVTLDLPKPGAQPTPGAPPIPGAPRRGLPPGVTDDTL
jgi:general secretion pathway protein N